MSLSREELDTSANQALGNPELRMRLLQHVAVMRNISTSQAQTLLQRIAFSELTPSSTVEQVLTHMQHPNFEPPANALDADLQTVFADDVTQNRVIRSLQLDQGISWMDALEQLHRGAEVAYEGGKRTLRTALEATRSKPEAIEANLVLLERRDAAVTRTLEQHMAPIANVRTDPRGMVLLDSGGDTPAGERFDVGKALADPVERENRLARARQFDGAYHGEEGRELFFEVDRQHLDVRQDIVRSLEVTAAARRAQGKAHQVGVKLDRAIQQSAEKQQRLRLLDAEIAALEGKREDLRPAATVADTALRTLEAPSGEAGKNSSTSENARVIEERIRAQGPRSRADWLRLLQADPSVQDVDQSAHLEVFLKVLHGEDADLSSVDAAEPPRDDINALVLERLRQLDRPMSAYPQTLEEMLYEDDSTIG